MERRRRLRLMLVAIPLLGVGAAGGIFLARWARTAAEARRAAEAAERWLSAVAANDEKAAIAAAGQLVPAAAAQTADADYARLAEAEGISPAFLTATFNTWDAQLWRHAHFFHELARSLTKGRLDDVQALFTAVVRQIEPHEREAREVAWPYAIWQRGFGVCDRQCWVLCELAYQCGWETQIVYLRDPATGQSPHTISEIRKPPSAVWFVDPYTQVLLPQESVDSVAGDAGRLAAIWPQNEKFREAIQHCEFWTPSYPQDYCRRNQALQAQLRALLADRCPRFGEDPRGRLAAYRDLRRGTASHDPQFAMGLWFYPFRLLRADMAGRARAALQASGPAAPPDPAVGTSLSPTGRPFGYGEV